MDQLKKFWAEIATIISAILLIFQLAEAFTGNRSLITGLLILTPLLVIGAAVWNYAFAKSVIDGIPRYKYHWVAKIGLMFIGVSILFSVIYTLAILDIVPDCCGLLPAPTSTAASTSTPTASPTPTPQPLSSRLYYMIVLDASEQMKESFGGTTKWDAALRSLKTLLDGFNPNAHYGLVTLGGSKSNKNSDSCNEPSVPALDFDSIPNLRTQIDSLEPTGGGSIYKAYALGNTLLEDLPSDTIRTLIFITGSNDACQIEDEWESLSKLLSVPNSIKPNTYSEIIVLDKDGFSTKTLNELNSLSINLNVQAPQNSVQLSQSFTRVAYNVEEYVIAAINPVASPVPACQTISPNLDTASFGGSAWINTPANCTTNITSGEPIPASGGYADLPSGTIIWVFVYPPNGPFYPQSPNACASSPSPYPSQGGGGWSVPIYFGNLGDPSQFFDLVIMVTDQAGSDYIGQRLYEDCSGGFFDGISAGDLASLNITTKATITIKTK